MPHLDPNNPTLGHRAPSERGITDRDPDRGLFEVPRPGGTIGDILGLVIDPGQEIPGTNLEFSPALAALGATIATGGAALGGGSIIGGAASLAASAVRPLVSVIGGGARITGVFPFRPKQLAVETILGAGGGIVASQIFGQPDAPATTTTPTPETQPDGTAPPQAPEPTQEAARLSAVDEQIAAMNALTPEAFAALSGPEQAVMRAQAAQLGIGVTDSEFDPTKSILLEQEIPGLGTIFQMGILTNDGSDFRALGQPIIPEQVRRDAESQRSQDAARIISALPAIQQFQQFQSTPAGRKLRESLGGVDLAAVLANRVLGNEGAGNEQFFGTGRISPEGLPSGVRELFNIPESPSLPPGVTASGLAQESGESFLDVTPNVRLEDLQRTAIPSPSQVGRLSREDQELFGFLGGVVGDDLQAQQRRLRR